MAEAATFAPPPLGRRALVPTARLLLIVNSLLLALAGWLLLPIDVATPTLAHAAYTAWTFLVVTALVALPLGGLTARSSGPGDGRRCMPPSGRTAPTGSRDSSNP